MMTPTPTVSQRLRDTAFMIQSRTYGDRNLRLMLEAIERLCAEAADALEAEHVAGAQLREALERYGRHDAECTRQNMRGPCSCGFIHRASEALGKAVS